MSASPQETLARVEDKVRGGATDAQLEQLLDAPAARVAAAPKKPTTVAKKPTATNVHQAGTTTKSKKKASAK